MANAESLDEWSKVETTRTGSILWASKNKAMALKLCAPCYMRRQLVLKLPLLANVTRTKNYALARTNIATLATQK